jgi:hypothetical protein
MLSNKGFVARRPVVPGIRSSLATHARQQKHTFVAPIEDPSPGRCVVFVGHIAPRPQGCSLDAPQPRASVYSALQLSARGRAGLCVVWGEPRLLLSDGERWPIKKGHHRFVALAIWLPDKTLAKTCADFSDLEIGPDGYLYLLSDKSSTIARLDDLPAGGGTAALLDAWLLRDLDGKPEGLTFTAQGRRSSTPPLDISRQVAVPMRIWAEFMGCSKSVTGWSAGGGTAQSGFGTRRAIRGQAASPTLTKARFLGC